VINKVGNILHVNDNKYHASTQPNFSNTEAVVDSGAQNHYLPVKDAGHSSSWGRLQGHAKAISASNTLMSVLGTAIIRVTGIEPLQARILKELNDPLISVPRLCSKGYTVVFTEKEVQVQDAAGNALAIGGRDPGEGGLFKLPINGAAEACHMVAEQPDNSENSADGVIYYMPNLSTYYGGISFKNKAERVHFYHAALGFPTVAGFVAALKSHLKLPGISAADVLANPPKTEATAKGHLRQHLKNVRSTKASNNNITAANHAADVQDSEGVTVEDGTPIDTVVEPVDIADVQAQQVLETRESIPGFVAEEQSNNTGDTLVSFMVGRLSADTTGKLQVNSVMGHTAVHVSYIQSANYIRLNAIKNRTEVNDMIMKTYNEATALGHKINLVLTDNEMSSAAKAYFAKLKVQQEMVEPYNHRANDTERHIQTVKRHVIATLAGRDPGCALENWDKAVQMAELTLSLLRRGTSEGQSSYHSYFGKEYDFNAHPIAPWGVKVQAFVPKALRKSWGYRSKVAFYMGPVNYRQHQLREPGAMTPFVRQQVVFLSEDVKYPRFTARDELIARITDLTLALKQKGTPPDTTLAEALGAYAAAFPQEDDDIDLLEATVMEDGAPVVWLASPLDFDEGNADTFPQVTHYDPDNYAPAPVMPDRVEQQHNAEHPALIMARYTGENSAPFSDRILQTEPIRVDIGEPTEHVPTGADSDRNIQTGPIKATVGVPTVHIPTGAYSTRGAKRHSVILDPMAEEKDPESILVLTEIDHKTLTMRKAMRTPDAEDWQRADVAEFLRFVSIKGIDLVHPDAIVQRGIARNVVKVLENKEGKPRRVRAAYNGSKRKDEVREEQYSNFSSDHLAKKIFCAALAARSKTMGARMDTLDLESFYLHERNKLPRTDFMFYDTTFFPKEVREKFSQYIRDDRILLSCTQAIYGMYDAGTIAGTVLSGTLSTNGYKEVDSTNLWVSDIPGEEGFLFNTNVDDFAIIHIPATKAMERLEKVLNDAGYKFVRAKSYTTERFQKFHFCGLDIEHDTQNHVVTLYLNGWVRKLLAKYNMENCTTETAPYKYARPVYTGKQAPVSEDDSAPLSAQLMTELRSKIGALNWGAACVNYDTALAVSKVGSKQANPTKALLREVNHILRYLAGHPNTVLQFHPCDMTLHTVSDASFCSETKGRSRAGGVLYLGGCDENNHPISSPVEVMSHIIDCIPDSAAEAEYVSVHDTTKRGIYCRNILEGIGYPQGTTDHECDNKCAVGIANNTVHDRKTKHIDRRYHWVKNEVKNGHFNVIWKEGVGNIADFFTKYLPQAEHEKYANIFTRQYTPSQEGVLGTKSFPQGVGV